MHINPPTPDRIAKLYRIKQATSYLAALAANHKLLWRLACSHEGLDPERPVTPFDAGNPWLGRLNRANAALWKARGEYELKGFTNVRLEGVEL